MAISTFSTVRHTPAGAGFRLASPVAVWNGQANVLGDASGGVVGHAFTVNLNQELNFVYKTDWISFITDTSVDPGAFTLQLKHHHELGNVTLDMDRYLALPTALSSSAWRLAYNGDLHLFLAASPTWWRRDFGGSDSERSIISQSLTNNNLGQTYQFRAGGRAWDARILASPDFWSLFGARAGAP